ncbi:MAG: S1 RNA-binding domain-containing protein, partial [Candidatus Komeilibacteria bacterium]
TKTNSKMAALLEQEENAINIPQVGDLVEGTVIYVGKNEIQLDINGVTTGIVRGKEIQDESGDLDNLKPGDKASATVVDLDNENGLVELSFRFAGHQKAWEKLESLQESGEIIKAKIIDANKGGLMIKVGNVIGFLPVSQLTTEHYPRIDGGDKNKILSHLKDFVNQEFKVKVIGVEEGEEKLIVSEKAAWEEKQGAAISKYKVGDQVDGVVTGVVDFGAFVEFGDGLEGLVHISELAWQRIDDPRDIIHVSDKIKAEIISVENSKISLSIKKLKTDPWHNVEKKYKVGQIVNGKILKVNPFGAFVELDSDIHGLAHVSELADDSVEDLSEILEIGNNYDFEIISIEPANHRLGLTLTQTNNAKKKVSAKSEDKVKDNEEEKEVVADTETTDDQKMKEKPKTSKKTPVEEVSEKTKKTTVTEDQETTDSKQK